MSIAHLLPFSAASVAAIVAVIALARSTRGLANWAFATGMLTLAAESVASGFIGRATTLNQVLIAFRWQTLSASFAPAIWLIFSLTYARGDYRTSLHKWRWFLAAIFVLPVGLAASSNSLTVRVTPSANGATWILNLTPVGIGLILCQLVGSVSVLMNLERTFRAAIGTMRWRIKFALLGIGMLFVVRLYTSSEVLLFRGVDPTLDALNCGALLLAALLALRSLFRAGRGGGEIEVYPSRTVLQGSLTILLAGIYLLTVGLLAKLVTLLGGYETFAIKAFIVLLAVVGLAVILQSDRVRLLLGRFVSRHFQRPLYDYRSMWKQFTAGTAACVEQADLSRTLVRLIAEMFKALSVSIWLVDDRKTSLQLAGSTSLSSMSGPDVEPRKAEAGDVIDYFLAHPDPVDFENATGRWADTLRASHPGVFLRGGNRVCVPLIGRGEVLGVITVGDRVGGTPFSLQDFDMLKCVADDAAASVLNVQLSQHLLQAKELEAFQTMAAFFVHDLKNAASTLNLMLKNLPVHFDDPAFRADALRGMEKTVTHINHLIARLGLLRHELKMQFASTDLGEVIRRALAGLEEGPGIEVTKDLAALPKVNLDPEQIAKVVINLVLNAREALPPQGGRIGVTTSRNDQWAVITVTDNGAGMSQEFMARSLFRPFQTTKKSGLGIGMFQSKMIVEAHRGRIKVDSTPGKGTSFQVMLPLSVAAQ